MKREEMLLRAYSTQIGWIEEAEVFGDGLPAFATSTCGA